VAYEGLLIVGFALMLGVLISQVGIYSISGMMEEQFKQGISADIPYWELLQTVILVLLMAFLSIALAIYPIVRMNISKILSHEK